MSTVELLPNKEIQKTKNSNQISLQNCDFSVNSRFESSQYKQQIKRSNTEENLLKKIVIQHNYRRDHLIKRNTSENQLNIGDPKRFTFEGSDDCESNENSENRQKVKHSVREQNKTNNIQTIWFIYNPEQSNENNMKVLKDDSNRVLNSPPSPRFGDVSISFGNDHERSSSVNNEHLQTEQHQEFQDSFAKILKDGVLNSNYSTFLV